MAFDNRLDRADSPLRSQAGKGALLHEWTALPSECFIGLPPFIRLIRISNVYRISDGDTGATVRGKCLSSWPANVKHRP